MYTKQKHSGLRTLIEDYSPLTLLIVLPISFVLCLLQYLLKSQSMLLLIIGCVLTGIPLLIFGIQALKFKGTAKSHILWDGAVWGGFISLGWLFDLQTRKPDYGQITHVI